jgi:hypothetical protein
MDVHAAPRRVEEIVSLGTDVWIRITRYTGAVYLSKLSGDEITEEQARLALATYGEIEKVWFPTATEKEMWRLPNGIWVQFEFYQDGRDALSVST